MKNLPLILLCAIVAFAFKNSLQKQQPEFKTSVAVYDNEEPAPEAATYSQYQIAMWYLKAHESFRPYEYPDGEFNSKGFGLNLSPDKVQWASDVLGFDCRSRDWTWQEGEKILQAYWSRKRNKFAAKAKDLEPHQVTAILLHSYNTGKYTNIRGCCGASVGCGRDNARIRSAHNKRRQFEWKLYNGQITDDDIAAIRQKAIAVEKKWKVH
jgi:hypothetical protein